MGFAEKYNKNYKRLLIIPAALLALSLIYLIIFYVQTGDMINKDVTLTGGTTITLFTSIPASEIESALSSIADFETRTITDNTGQQTQIIIIVPEEKADTTIQTLETFLGQKLDENNSSIETVSSSLGQNFYKQLIISVLIAFFWMAAVVFLIFSKGKKTKALVVVLNILLGILLGSIFSQNYFTLKIILIIFLMAYLIYTYIKNSVPSFAVMLSAFADIVMTLAVVDLLGMKLSSAGIVAFLMLIGYSVDTDILLTTRILRRKESINRELFGAFKTGVTMTLTSIIAVAAALIVVMSLNSVLTQIFTILLIGLAFDLLNTWLTNASIIKWYASR